MYTTNNSYFPICITGLPVVKVTPQIVTAVQRFKLEKLHLHTLFNIHCTIFLFLVHYAMLEC